MEILRIFEFPYVSLFFTPEDGRSRGDNSYRPAEPEKQSFQILVFWNFHDFPVLDSLSVPLLCASSGDVCWHGAVQWEHGHVAVQDMVTKKITTEKYVPEKLLQTTKRS